MSELRNLPSVDRVLSQLKELRGFPSTLIADEIRSVLALRREAIQSGVPASDQPVEDEVMERLAALAKPSLRRVINATGVVLHTNLGRASLGDFHPIGGSSNLEYDLETGKRGQRDTHTAPLLERLLQRPAILVNNNAAAVFLVLHELAPGSEVIVSRGELIEIGDGFRIPEIMARSGAILREVGTTNRTQIEDYRRAVNDRTHLIMRVHPSNFHISGFTARPKVEELAELAKQAGIPLYEDLGSGCLVDLKSLGIAEPVVKDSFAAGVNILSFSCDKLLGGPQTGVIAGDAELVQRVRRNFMYRAFRLDKLVIECLERTLRHLVLEQWSKIPALDAIFTPLEKLRERAASVQLALGQLPVTTRESASPIGGGSTPDQTLPTWVVEITAAHPDGLLKRLRQSAVPVIGRIEADKVLLDMRTAGGGEISDLIASVKFAMDFRSPSSLDSG